MRADSRPNRQPQRDSLARSLRLNVAPDDNLMQCSIVLCGLGVCMDGVKESKSKRRVRARSCAVVVTRHPHGRRSGRPGDCPALDSAFARCALLCPVCPCFRSKRSREVHVRCSKRKKEEEGYTYRASTSSCQGAPGWVYRSRAGSTARHRNTHKVGARAAVAAATAKKERRADRKKELELRRWKRGRKQQQSWGSLAFLPFTTREDKKNRGEAMATGGRGRREREREAESTKKKAERQGEAWEEREEQGPPCVR